MHQVLLRLDEGAPALAQLAAETGFSDHSHKTRTLVAQVGLAPLFADLACAGEPPRKLADPVQPSKRER